MLTFSHLPPSSPFQVIVFTVFLLGPDLLSAGTCSEKKCGALQLRRQTLFFLKKLATFFSHHRACVSFFVHSRLVVSLAGRPFFPHAKICRSFCGGGAVRPNMQSTCPLQIAIFHRCSPNLPSKKSPRRCGYLLLWWKSEIILFTKPEEELIVTIAPMEKYIYRVAQKWHHFCMP